VIELASVASPPRPPAAPDAAASRRAAPLPPGARAGRSRAASALASALLGAALAGVALGAEGGSELTRTTATEMALILSGGAIAAVSIVFGRARPAYGAVCIAAFALLVAVTALSMLWSVVPALSWQETSRLLAYLSVLAASVASVRLSSEGWTVVLRGLAIGGGLVIAYALASRVWPGSLAENEIYSRIGQPFGYSNAVGVTAALTVPAALWLGTRRSGHAGASALAYPLLSLLVVALFLSYSRSSLVAAGIGVLLWLAFVPLRLRTLALLLVASALSAPVIAWAASRDGFTEYNVLLEVRESVATEFGLLLLALVAVSLVAGLLATQRLTLRPPGMRMRLRAGAVATVAALLVPVFLVTSLVLSDRGFGGTIEHQAGRLTQQDAQGAGGPERLTSASSSRGQYWREAGDIFKEREWGGAGAGTFGIARLQVRDNELVSRHAHGYVVETMATLGILGLGASALVTLAFLLAAARAVGLWPRLLRSPWDAERVGLVALALVALVFGLQSILDWTWLVPGPAVMALVAAGWLAGRGPLRRRGPAEQAVEALPPPTPGSADAPTAALPPPTPGTADAPAEALPPPTPGTAGAPARPRARRRLPRFPLPAARHLLAAAGVLIALLAAWAAWQPERADREAEEALNLIADDKLDEAAAAAERAHEIDPLASKPLLVRGAVEDARGDQQAALAAFEQAVKEHPAEPQVWHRLADFQLNVLDDPRAALATARAGLKLDFRSQPLQQIFLDAQAKLRTPPAAPAPLPGTPPVPGQPPAQPIPPAEPAPPMEAAPPIQPAPPKRERGFP
jgi:O-Antigen ligase